MKTGCILQIGAIFLAALLGSGVGTALVLRLFKKYKIDLEPDDK